MINEKKIRDLQIVAKKLFELNCNISATNVFFFTILLRTFWHGKIVKYVILYARFGSTNECIIYFEVNLKNAEQY